MLVLVMSLLYWTQSEGFCTETRVTISGDTGVLPAGRDFNVRCEFVCLRPKHVAQVWKASKHQGKVALVNMTSARPTVTLELKINAATEADSGDYSCMTQPPNTISASLPIQISHNLTTPSTPKSDSTPMSDSTPKSDSTQLPSTAASMQGQMWCWMLLGKIAILLLSLVSLAVKCRRS